MKSFCRKLSEILRHVFGWGVVACVFVGGMTFFGYVAAICIGGDIAAEICRFISKDLMPVVIKCSSVLMILGVLVMYLNGEVALTTSKK